MPKKAKEWKRDFSQLWKFEMDFFENAFAYERENGRVVCFEFSSVCKLQSSVNTEATSQESSKSSLNEIPPIARLEMKKTNLKGEEA